jgi:hypothetical protein
MDRCQPLSDLFDQRIGVHRLISHSPLARDSLPAPFRASLPQSYGMR